MFAFRISIRPKTCRIPPAHDQATTRPVLLLTAALFGLWGLGVVRAQTSAPGSGTIPAGAASLLAEAFPDGAAPAGDGRQLFAAVLGSPVFEHATVGPFELHVKASGTSDKLLATAAAGLGPVVETLERHWPARGDGQGLVSGVAHPIVLAETTADFEAVLSLLDHCEGLGYSGWKPQNEVFTVANRTAETARTWEVQLFNLQHRVIAERSKDWLSHGIGYYTLAHLVNRAVRQGAWGLSPPWFDQGLIDELDIETYDRAWVGGESWSSETAGWFRAGWSGFLPTGSKPPPPPSGPPHDLAVKVSRTGNAWDDRGNSPSRHWNELAQDRASAAPASFAFMADHQSFLPRDRAYARCTLHLLLSSGERTGLLAQLDQPAVAAPDGMLSAEPLTVLVSQALGGVPAVTAFEALPLSEVLAAVGREDIAQRMRALQAEGLLALTDHREQSHWLYRSWKGAMSERTELFRLIMEAEHEQQLHEWALIGEQLDRGMDAALGSRKSYPKTEKDREKVLAAFRGALDGEPASVADGVPEGDGR